MLRPVRMQKIRIVALKSVLSLLIKKLHELGLVDLVVSHYDTLEKGKPLAYFDEVSQELVRIRAIKSMLTPQNEAPEHTHHTDLIAEAHKVTLDEEIKMSLAKRDQATELRNQVREELAVLAKFALFGAIDFSKLQTKTLTFFVGSVSSQEKLKEIRQLLTRHSKHYELTSVQIRNEVLFVCVFPLTETKLIDLLLESGVSKIDVPASLTLPSVRIDEIKKIIFEKQREYLAATNDLLILSKKHYHYIDSLEHALSIEAERAEIASRFNFTKATAIIEGWIKETDTKKLEHTIASFGTQALLEKMASDDHEMPPVVLDNPHIAFPLQFITQNYSLPNYYEIDPTVIYLFTIPLLYGMIVGDVLYGVMSIIIASFFMKKFSKSYIMSNVSRIWYYGAIPSILFGLIFDEWAGFSHFHLLEILEKWGVIDLASFGITGPFYDFNLSRAHNLPTVIGLTIMVGLLHLAVGFILGAINEWHHSKKHALAKIAWIGVEIGGTIAVMAYLFGIVSVSLGTIGVGILVLSIITLAFTEGVMGILELPGFAGNVLSYARIAAIGVVGVILAEIINEFLVPLPQQGIIALILLPIFIALHAANTFIAMFEALIQGGRLNIIEFKLKFMKGGGRVFKPFAIQSK